MKEIKPDSNHIWAIALFHALKGDFTLLNKLKKEASEILIKSDVSKQG